MARPDPCIQANRTFHIDILPDHRPRALSLPLVVLIALAATPQARADTIPETNDGERVVEIAAGGYHSCARVKTGRVFCWGGNGNGQLGDGRTTDRTA